MTVRELLDRIGSDELTEWRAYHNLNPWGEDREDLRAGIIASTVANCMTTKSTWKPSDFMPRFKHTPEARPKTMAELKMAAMKLVGVMKGKFKKAGG